MLAPFHLLSRSLSIRSFGLVLATPDRWPHWKFDVYLPVCYQGIVATFPQVTSNKVDRLTTPHRRKDAKILFRVLLANTTPILPLLQLLLWRAQPHIRSRFSFSEPIGQGGDSDLRLKSGTPHKYICFLHTETRGLWIS